MPRYLCPGCGEVTQLGGTSRFDFCPACGQPLTVEDLMPIRPGILTKQDGNGSSAVAVAPESASPPSA
jgi:hypothetical protein